MVEEITLVSEMIQNQDDHILNNSNLQYESHDVHNQVQNDSVSTRIFSSKNYLKEFILWIVLCLCLLIIAGPFTHYISYTLPAVKTRNSAAHIFSEERARDYLINLTRYGSRVSNTYGNFYACNFLISQIERIHSMSKRHLHFEIDLQNFSNSYHHQLQNVIVRISNPVTNSNNISSLMLSAHYDSVEFSPGSSDDGSGVVILLELFSNLINDLTISFSDINLIILFTNGEEMGLQGAQAFINNHHWRLNIHRFINVDGATCNDVANLIRMKPSQLIYDYSRVSRPRANVILERIPQWFGMNSDYHAFSLNGSLLGYDFGFILDSYTYHTPLDHLSLIKQGVLQELGENLVILSRNILRNDLYKIENEINNDSLIYFDIFGRYLIIYKMYTSIIIQKIFIILIIIISIILIIFDHIYHYKKSFQCIDTCCIYFNFKYPFILRIISIIIYIISNLMSIFVGFLFEIIFIWNISKIRPAFWFGNSILAIIIFSFPYLIGFLISKYLWNIFHYFILRKCLKNSFKSFNIKYLNKINFYFEQNLSILFIYIFLMFISIILNDQLLYIIFLWSIFLCPIYIFLIIFEFIIHWKKISLNIYIEKSYQLFLPLIISLLPLIHTIEIINRLLRIFIPFLTRSFSFGWSFFGNINISSVSIIPILFFLLIFIPILQRKKYFCRILFLFLLCFFIIFIFVYYRQAFTNIHPHLFYVEHISKSIFKVNKLSNIPFTIPSISQSSSITLITLTGLILSPILEHFSSKTGHILSNKQCFTPTNCTFNDTFNRKIAIQQIQMESIKDFTNYTIVIEHILSYNIQISSNSSINFIVRNQLNIPRTKTIIDIISNSELFSFDINIKINRCDLNDSPFLLLFTRLLPNIVPIGSGQCRAIEDNAILTIDLNTLSNQSK